MELLTKKDLLELKNEIMGELKKIQGNPSQQIPGFLKSHQVKELLNCSDSKLEALRKSGKLPCTKVIGTLYYKYDEVLKLFNNS